MKSRGPLVWLCQCSKGGRKLCSTRCAEEPVQGGEGMRTRVQVPEPKLRSGVQRGWIVTALKRQKQVKPGEPRAHQSGSWWVPGLWEILLQVPKQRNLRTLEADLWPSQMCAQMHTHIQEWQVSWLHISSTIHVSHLGMYCSPCELFCFLVCLHCDKAAFRACVVFDLLGEELPWSFF